MPRTHYPGSFARSFHTIANAFVAQRQTDMANKRRRSVSSPFITQKKRKVVVPSKSRKARSNNISALAGKVSKKSTGRSKVKSIVHRKKRVKVSKSLRAKVKKVIQGGAFKGTYHTTRFGTIGFTTTGNGGVANIEDITASMGGYTNQLAFQKINKDPSGYFRVFWAQPLTATEPPTLAAGSEWQFFTPLKIVDAASVLWNDKTIAENYGIQTGNFNTVHVESSGAAIDGITVSNPQLKGLKIHVDNSYVKFILKNNSQRICMVTIYNCVPKNKFPDATALQSFKNALLVEADGANSAYLAATSIGHTTFEQEQALFSNPAFSPNMCKAFTASWKYEKVRIRIAPGETCTHSVQGPRGYELDYRKLYDAGVNQQGFAYKGTTMQVFMSMETDMVYTTANVEGGNGTSGHYITGISATSSLVDPISIQWDEVYKLSIPDIAGFKTANGVGGTMQVLNKHLPRMAFGNFSRVSSNVTDPVYTTYDEENVAAPIVASSTN